MRRILTLFSLALITGVTRADVSVYTDSLKQAQTRNEAKDYVGARKLLDIALAAATTPAEKARVLIAMGRVYSDEANYPKAREAWQQVTDSEGSTDAEKWGGLALIGGSYLTEKNYPEARRVLSQVIANPLVPAYMSQIMRMQIATTYSLEGKPDVAQVELTKIADDSKVTPIVRFTARMGIGQLNSSAGQWNQARIQYLKASQLPTDAFSLATARYRIEQTYWNEGDEPRAKAVNIGFKNKLIDDAAAFMSAKKFEQARRAYHALLITSGEHEDPGMAASWRYQIAQAFGSEANYDQTREQLQETLNFIAGFKDKKQLSPAAASSLQLVEQASYDALAGSYYRQGDKARAAQEYQKLLQRPDLNPQVRADAEKYLALSKA